MLKHLYWFGREWGARLVPKARTGVGWKQCNTLEWICTQKRRAGSSSHKRFCVRVSSNSVPVPTLPIHHGFCPHGTTPRKSWEWLKETQSGLESSIPLGLRSDRLWSLSSAPSYVLVFLFPVHECFHLDTLHLPVTSGHAQASLSPLDISAPRSRANSQHGCCCLSPVH